MRKKAARYRQMETKKMFALFGLHWKWKRFNGQTVKICLPSANTERQHREGEKTIYDIWFQLAMRLCFLLRLHAFIILSKWMWYAHRLDADGLGYFEKMKLSNTFTFRHFLDPSRNRNRYLFTWSVFLRKTTNPRPGKVRFLSIDSYKITALGLREK